jgi:hypothetical protein
MRSADAVAYSRSAVSLAIDAYSSLAMLQSWGEVILSMLRFLSVFKATLH